MFERYTAAGWVGIFCPHSSQRHTHTHTERKTEKTGERARKATIIAKHINFASQNPGRQELRVSFEHQFTHAEHMEYFPLNLIILWKKKSCYTLKWNVSVFRRAGGQCGCGNTHAVFSFPLCPIFLSPSSHLTFNTDISQYFLYFPHNPR